MTRFLNVDLELVTRMELSPLLARFAASMLVLRDSVDDGLRTVWLELAGGNPPDAEDAIAQFVTIIQSLPGELRRLWDACDDRCFNVGIQGDAAPYATVFSLTRASLAAVADLGARLDITVYGSENAPAPPSIDEE